MPRELRNVVSEFAAAKHWSIEDLAKKIEVPKLELYQCLKTNKWPSYIEDKILELFVENLPDVSPGDCN